MAKSFTTKKSGSFMGKSNKLGQGGRAAQLKAKGVPGAVIGEIARMKGAAPGQKNYHRTKMRKMRAMDGSASDAKKVAEDVAAGVQSKSRKMRKAKRPITEQPKALALEKEPDVVSEPNGKKLSEGFRKRKAHRGGTKKRGFGPGVGLGLGGPNPGKITQDSSTPMFSPGKGTMPAAKLDAGGVPMKRKAKRAAVMKKRMTSMKQAPTEKTETAQIMSKMPPMKRAAMPQRRTHRSMSGMDMLMKATKRK